MHPDENIAVSPKSGKLSSLRPCPVCRNRQRDFLYRQKFSGLSEGSFLHGYDVCVCSSCGLGLADNVPPAEEFDRYYAEMSQWEFLDTKGIESPQDTERFESVAGYFLTENTPLEASILDIGCATGGMLAAFKRKGFHRLLGMDPSPRCAELAQKNYGIEVRTGTVGNLDLLPPGFDVVTLSGVLEHLYDPGSALEKIHALLGPEGLFYVNVPDVEGFVLNFDGPYQQFSIEHILFFTSKSLINLMAAKGFEPVRMIKKTFPYTESFNYPVIEGLFKKSVPTAWEKDDFAAPALQKYLVFSKELSDKIDRQLEKLATSREPLLVWGVGTNTQRLIASSPLSRANIVAFVDSNPHYHGKKMHGIPVLSPAEIRSYPQTILISSFIFRKEIERQIRQTLEYDNPLIFLGVD